MQNRANKLFESVFSPEDEILIVLYKSKWPSRKKIRLGNHIFKQIEGLKKSNVEFSLIKRLYDPFDNDEIWNRAIIKTKLRHLNYKEIIKALSNKDFPDNTPSTEFEIHLINLSQKVIFHMYDDRGLDIAAADKSSLYNVYQKKTDWLLDYDFKLIQQRMYGV